MKISTPEIFTWKDKLIQQDEKVFKIGTDAILLGAWIPKIIGDVSHVLDVGTGTGILSIMMASNFPYAKIISIDIDENAVELAHKNFMKSGHPLNMEVHCADLFKDDFLINRKYDLVICNPPYYQEGSYLKPVSNVSAKQGKQSVHHWIKLLTAKVEPGGHLFLVLPYEMAFEWIKGANQSYYYCHHRMNVCSFKNDINPKRCLLHFSDELIKPSFTRLNIYTHGNYHTEEFIAFSSIIRMATSCVTAAGI